MMIKVIIELKNISNLKSEKLHILAILTCKVQQRFHDLMFYRIW